MRVLITGGAGFIGQHLAETLLAQGHEPFSYDLRQPTRVIYDGAAADVRNAAEVRYVMNRLRPEVCFHLASKVGVRHYLGSHGDTLTTIIDGTRNVAEACALYGVRMVNASTSEVYGKGSIPMKENQDLLYGPTHKSRWVYGMSKALAEQIIMETPNLDWRIFRPFNIVGAGQSPEGGLLFPTFAQQALLGGPLTVHGFGSQTRTFCGVQDLVPAIVTFSQIPRARDVVMNIGSDVPVSIGHIAFLFASRAELRRPERRIALQYVPYGEALPATFEDALQRVPDLSVARDLMGWLGDAVTPLEQLVDDALDTASARF